MDFRTVSSTCFYSRSTPMKENGETGKKIGIRTHNCVMAFFRNILACLHICSRTIRYKNAHDGKVFYLNRNSCVKWIRKGDDAKSLEGLRSLSDEQLLTLVQKKVKPQEKPDTSTEVQGESKDNFSGNSHQPARSETAKSSLLPLEQPAEVEKRAVTDQPGLATVQKTEELANRSLANPVAHTQTETKIAHAESIETEYETDSVKARRLALSINSSTGSITPANLITAISKKLREMMEKDASSVIGTYIWPVREQIKTLHAAMAKEYTQHTMQFSGQASMNRQLLVAEAEWKKAFQDSGIILGLLAMDVIDELLRETTLILEDPLFSKEHEKARATQKSFLQTKEAVKKVLWNEDLNFLCEFTSQASGESRKATISGTFRHALEEHPVLTETVMLNSTKNALYCAAYIRQKEGVAKTLPPILAALQKAFESIAKEADFGKIKSNFDSSYNPQYWEGYGANFYCLVHRLRLMSTEQRNEFVKADLAYERARETQSGLIMMFTKMGITKFDEQTKETFVEKFLQSDLFIHPDIAHLLFDRLHFGLGILDERVKINIKGGTMTALDLFKGAIDKLALSGVSIQNGNTIAAEQLYVRIMWLSDWCDQNGVAKIGAVK